MKKISFLGVVLLMLLCSVSCTQTVGDAPVTPASWKGLEYIVKKGTTGEEIRYIDTVWTEEGYRLQVNTNAIPAPGDRLRVTAVRSGEGQNCGIFQSSEMILYLKMRNTNGNLVRDTLYASVQCYYFDLNHFCDPYCTFTLPAVSNGDSLSYIETADVDVYLNFNAYGTYVDRSGVTKHEDPYLGGLETTQLTQYTGTTRSYPTTSSHVTSTSIQIYSKQ